MPHSLTYSSLAARATESVTRGKKELVVIRDVAASLYVLLSRKLNHRLEGACVKHFDFLIFSCLRYNGPIAAPFDVSNQVPGYRILIDALSRANVPLFDTIISRPGAKQAVVWVEAQSRDD